MMISINEARSHILPGGSLDDESDAERWIVVVVAVDGPGGFCLALVELVVGGP